MSSRSCPVRHAEVRSATMSAEMHGAHRRSTAMPAEMHCATAHRGAVPSAAEVHRGSATMAAAAPPECIGGPPPPPWPPPPPCPPPPPPPPCPPPGLASAKVETEMARSAASARRDEPVMSEPLWSRAPQNKTRRGMAWFRSVGWWKPTNSVALRRCGQSVRAPARKFTATLARARTPMTSADSSTMKFGEWLGAAVIGSCPRGTTPT